MFFNTVHLVKTLFIRTGYFSRLTLMKDKREKFRHSHVD